MSSKVSDMSVILVVDMYIVAHLGHAERET